MMQRKSLTSLKDKVNLDYQIFDYRMLRSVSHSNCSLVFPKVLRAITVEFLKKDLD